MTSGEMRAVAYALTAFAVGFVVVAAVVPGALLWAAVSACVLMALASSAFLFSGPHHEDEAQEPEPELAPVELEATLVP